MNTKTVMSLAVLSMAGCATIQIPPERLEQSEASIRGAEEMGAQNVPAARLHVQMARDQTETAKKMAAQGDARSVLVMARAEADAELALGLAREVSVHTEAMRASEDLKAVQARGNP